LLKIGQGQETVVKTYPELLQPTIDYKRVADRYFEYYNGMDGVYRSGMASVLAVGMAISIYEFPKNRKLKVILFSAVLLLFSGLYFLKKDSADGCLLIWCCSLEMIQDKPLSGHGSGGWRSLGVQTASSDSLRYDGVSEHGLFYIKCHSEGNQERPFILEDGKMVFL
jgi:hypothetical protein